MVCGQCGTANPAGARFCMNCGTALERRCTSCSEPLPDEAKFCPHCGHPVGAPAAAPAAPAPAPRPADRLAQYVPRELQKKLAGAREAGGSVGERRIVTMLFCDVKGSTAAAEQLDPEDWAEIMNGAFEQLISPVYRYEGMLARLMGDAILAFFGAPIGHEDDPERAVLAALDILQGIEPYARQVQRRWGLDFDVRIGINTGLVVVGEVGSDMRLEYTAMGDAVNLASRLEQTAEPGTVQISLATYKLVAPLFETEPLGSIEVKGKREPVPVWRVSGRRAQRGQLRGLEGLHSDVVGRDGEVAALLEAAGRLQRGIGGIVGLIGEAGLGKSRLVAELRERLAAEERLGTEVSWYEGRALSYQVNTPYSPIRDLLGDILRLDSAPDGPEAYAYLHARLEEIAPGLGERSAPYLASVCEIDLDPDSAHRVRYLSPPMLKGRVSTAVTDLVRALAERRPTVLVFEDLHWADAVSMDLVESLLPLTDQTSVLLVGLLRPRPSERSWAFHEVAARTQPHRYAGLSLSPLPPDDAATLVANLLRVEDLPAALRTRLLDHSEGNPYYLEELIRSLRDSGAIESRDGRWFATREVESIRIPETLAGVLTSRLDSLEEGTRRVAQAAAVIGREFRYGVLQSVYQGSDLDDGLRALQRRGILREKARDPEPVYWFKHALLVQTAYDSQLRSVRREIHGRVADALIEAAPHQVGEIARHLLDARRRVEALPWVVKAATAAARAYATEDAIRLYSEALDIVDTEPHPDLAREAFEGLGNALALGGRIPEAMDVYVRMRDWAAKWGDPSMEFSALNKRALFLALAGGDSEGAKELLSEVEERGAGGVCDAGLAEAGMVRCFIHTAAGELDKTMYHLSRAAELGEKLEAEEPRLFGQVHIANTLFTMVEFDKAREQARRALDEAEQHGNRQWTSSILGGTLARLLVQAGHLDEGRASAERALEIAEEIGAVHEQGECHYTLASILRAQGDWEGAIEHSHAAAQLASMLGYFYLQAIALCTAGSATLEIAADLLPDAQDLHTRALQISEAPLAASYGSLLWAEIGRCALEGGQVDGAEALFQRALDEPNAASFLGRPVALLGLALARLAQGREGEAIPLIDQAREFVTEHQMRSTEAQVHLVEGRCRATTGDLAGAEQAFARAAALADAQGLDPISFRARAARAHALAGLARADEAEAVREAARPIRDRLAARLEDPFHRDAFLRDANRQLQA